MEAINFAMMGKGAIITFREGLELALASIAFAVYLREMGSRTWPVFAALAGGFLCASPVFFGLDWLLDTMEGNVTKTILLLISAFMMVDVALFFFFKPAFTSPTARNSTILGVLFCVAYASFRESSEVILFATAAARSGAGWTADLVGGLFLGAAVAFAVGYGANAVGKRLPARALFASSSAALAVLAVMIVVDVIRG